MGQTPQFAEYPRGSHGTASKLDALQAAFSGAYWILASTIGLFIVRIALLAGSSLIGNEGVALLAFFAGIGLFFAMFIVNFFIAFIFAKKIAYAKDKDIGYAVMLAIGSALLSPCFFGIGGAVVLQQTSINEFKKYGIKVGFFGVDKAALASKRQELVDAGKV